MTITRVSAGPVATAYNTAMQPAAGSYAIGDCLIAVYTCLMGTPTISTPAGWTDIGDNTNCPQCRVFAKIAVSAAETIPSIQFGGDFQYSYVVAYRGVDAGLATAFAALGRQSNSAANIVGPSSSRTPSATGSLVIFVGNKNKTSTTDGSTWTPPTGFSLVVSQIPNGARPCGAFCESIQTSIVAIAANQSIAGSKAEGSAGTNQGMMIGLLAAVSPGPQYTSDPTLSTLAATSASFTQTLDSTATAYAVAVAHGAGTPSATQIKAGQNSSGSAAVSAANGAVTAAVQKSLTLSGLTASTAYDFFFVGNNANGDTAVKSVLNQTTPSVSTITATVNSANTDGYTVGYTPGATGTVYLVALIKGSATPTSAQVRTGTPTGFIARFSKAATNAVADTLSATGLTLPKADLHIILNTGGTNDSPVTSFLNQLKAPSAGRQYCSLGNLSGSSPFVSMTPLIAPGDVLDIVSQAPSAYAVLVTSAGDVEVDAFGDESLELLGFNAYDDSAGAMYYTADSTFVINNPPPIPNVPPGNAFTYFLPKNAAITSIDLSGLASSPSSLTVSYADSGSVLAGLGLAISAGHTLGGTTPNADSISGVDIVASDPYTGAVTLSGYVVIGKVTVPDVSGYNRDDIDAATLVLQSTYLGQATAFQQSQQPYGTFLSQSPAAGQSADPNSVVTMTFSGGAPGAVRDRYGFNFWMDSRA